MFNKIKSRSRQLISAVNSILKLGNSPWNWEPQQKKPVQVKEQDNSLDNSAAAQSGGGEGGGGVNPCSCASILMRVIAYS